MGAYFLSGALVELPPAAPRALTLIYRPNIQSLPKEGGYRGCIRPPSGRVLIKADLNQIELRVLAAITGDENMREVFRSGGDLHLNTAQAISGREVKKEDPERQKAKAVNFGLTFGMGVKRFRDTARRDYGVEMSEKAAKEAKRKLLDAYPAVGAWHKRESTECELENFETHTLLGRRCVVEPSYDGGPAFTERLNAPVQGTAADILKLALRTLYETRDNYPGAYPVLTVHDEVVIECPIEDAKDVSRWLSESLIEAVESVLGAELAGEDCVEVSILESWGGD
jgi:DNA polymerase I